MQPYRRPMPPQGGYPGQGYSQPQQNYPPRGYPAQRPQMPPQQPRYPQQYPVPQQQPVHPMQQQMSQQPQQYPLQQQMPQQQPSQGLSKIKSMLYGLLGFIAIVAAIFLYSFIQFMIKYKK